MVCESSSSSPPIRSESILSGPPMDGGSDQQRPRIYGCPLTRLYPAGGGQDWEFARWLVRGIYVQPALHCLGGLRRLQRLTAERCADSRAHLDRVHEESIGAASVRRHERLRAAHGSSGCATG